MNKQLVQKLLREYDKQRFQKEREVESKREELFNKYPDLKVLDNRQNEFAIEKIKAIFNDPKNKKKNIEELEKKLKELNKEKDKLYKKYNLSKDILEIKYDCEICKDTGRIKNGDKLENCNCLKQKIINENYNKSNLNMLDKENFSTFSLKYYPNKENQEKYNENKSPRDNMKEILELSKSFVKNFENSKDINLMFTGNTGLGKTFLINAISKELLDQGYTVFYQKAPTMLDRLMQTKYNAREEYDALMEYILSSDLLVIDDLTEKTTESKNIELFTIIDTRLNSRKPTIISTNLILQDFPLVFEARIVSRISGNYTIKKFFGEDIRLQKKKEKNEKNGL